MANVPQYAATLMESVARIEATLDGLSDQIAQRASQSERDRLEHDVAIKSLERRTGKLENRQAGYAGGSGVAGIVLGAIVEAFFSRHG